MTAAAAEGLSLKHTRQVHILEPHWNEGRIRQVIGRAVRIDSHVDLPAAQRKVDVYRWVSTNPDITLAPGMHIYQVAQAKQKVLDKFDDLLKEASIPVTIKQMVQAQRKPKRKPKRGPPSQCAGKQPPCPPGCKDIAKYCRTRPGRATCRGVPVPCRPKRCRPVRAHCRRGKNNGK